MFHPGFQTPTLPHEIPNVRRLAWSRGYVLVIHGGGATPVTQTPDTDLNQHVRREYTADEASQLAYQSRNSRGSGKTVPKLSHEQIIDALAEVWQRKHLHVAAAAGYKKQGPQMPWTGQRTMKSSVKQGSSGGS